MNMWEVLDIEPTMELNIIKQAYAKRLKIYRPDEDAEAFQQLREAYQMATQYVKRHLEHPPQTDHIDYIVTNNIEAVELEESRRPISQIYKSTEVKETFVNQSEQERGIKEKELKVKLENIYNNFFDRIKLESWQVILSSDIMWSLKNKNKTSKVFLEFLIGHHYLPQKVWLLLDEYFEWSKEKDDVYKQDELMIIAYIKEQINRKIPLDYTHFKSEADIDYERYLAYREKVFKALEYEEYHMCNSLIQQAEKIYQDDYELWRLKGIYYLGVNQMKHAISMLEQYMRENPYHVQNRIFASIIKHEKNHLNTNAVQEEAYSLYSVAGDYLKLDLLKRTSDYLLKFLERNPSNEEIKVLLIDVYKQMLARIERQKEDNINVGTLDYKREEIKLRLNEVEDLIEKFQQQRSQQRQHSQLNIPQSQSVIKEKNNIGKFLGNLLLRIISRGIVFLLLRMLFKYLNIF